MQIPLHVRLNKPEYVYRPAQLFRRLQRLHLPSDRPLLVKLPWGHQLRVNPTEVIGASILQLGLYDLPASEVAWRLFPEGGCSFDIGANLGYFSSLLAARGGPHARVVAFEPSPEVFAQLSENAALWGTPVELRQQAVGDRDGVSTLLVPTEKLNGGLARLREAKSPLNPDAPTQSVSVPVIRLDSLEPRPRIDFLKIDIEGAELNALKGAEQLLAQRLIRDILFEDHEGSASAVLTLLRAAGYSIYRIRREFLGPRLVAPETNPRQFVWEPPNYLATLDPSRALELVSPRGWQVLKRRRRR